ncbi:MAG TPA: TAXI family TRAP transporter solute-binding subunit [Candidatus Competibacter sp.]|nr:TAXI family TRAP transporter solute-binding subunit [Candidatus Competibacter sp.]
MNRWLQFGFLFSLLSLACIAQAAFPGEQTIALQKRTGTQINKGAVGIIAGGVNGTYIRIAADMATVLDSDNLRVLAIVGKGSAQNIDDLLYLKGIDMAIVQSDVLEYLKRQGIYKDIDKRINYIAKLYNEEFHLLANSEIKNLNDLAGRKVNFDVKGSGTAITASIIFDTLKISVEPLYDDQATALEKLKNGEIAALAYVAGKPAQLFEKITANDKLHFLSIDHTPALLETYLPTHINSQDYPLIIQQNNDIKTVAVGAVLAVYNWKKGHGRDQKVTNFANHFLDHFSDFLQPARHPKWQEVSLSATIPGWTRLPSTQEWLQRH